MLKSTKQSKFTKDNNLLGKCELTGIPSFSRAREIAQAGMPMA